MRDLDLVFSRLSGSRFRSRFRLGEKERAYLAERGLRRSSTTRAISSRNGWPLPSR
jgi:hypothetical protein